MATVTNVNGFGRPHGVNPALLRDGTYLSTKSFVTGGLGASANLLTDASAVTGDTSAFYSIWFITCGCDDSAAFMALLYEDTAQYADHAEGVGDAEVRFNVAASQNGMFTWSSDTPVKLKPGYGLSLDIIVAPGSSEYNMTIGYTLSKGLSAPE